MTDGLSVPLRLAGFLLVALAVFAAAWGVGRAVGPVDTEVDDGHHEGATSLVTTSADTLTEGAAW